MKLNIKGLIIVLAAFLIVSGLVLSSNIYETYFNLDPASSTVLVESGVSGVVTITDPYLNKTSDIIIDFYPISKGSGVILSEDGYIITAFHVIGNPSSIENQKLKLMEDNDIKQYLEQKAVMDYIKYKNPNLVNEITNNKAIITPENLFYNDIVSELIIQNNLVKVKYYKQIIRIKTPSKTGIGSKTFNAKIIDVGNPDQNEDIALLKIDNIKGLPYLPVSSQKFTGEEVKIYGYPGYKGDQYQYLIKPSSSEGVLTSKYYNNFGIAYYKTNAKTARGISGGPVVNKNNKVIGILIYGIEDQNQFKRSIMPENSMFLSSDYIIEILNRNNVPFKN